MGTKTGIQWTDHTFNPWRGCTKVSAGCAHCYADTLSKRNPKVLGVWGPKGSRAIAAEPYWKLPIAWNRAARLAGQRRRVFCASLADVFEGEDTMPAEARGPVHSARIRLFDLIDDTPFLDWLLVTKRPENIRGLWLGGYMTPPRLMRRPNVWLLTSVENQEAADTRIPELLKCRDLAPVLGLSCEPLLGPVDLRSSLIEQRVHPTGDWRENTRSRLDWVIAGDESGDGRRLADPQWSRDLLRQCGDFDVAYFQKQLDINGQISGDIDQFPEDLRVREFPVGRSA